MHRSYGLTTAPDNALAVWAHLKWVGLWQIASASRMLG